MRSLMTVLTALALVLTACGGQDAGDAPAPDTDIASPTSPADDDDTTETEDPAETDEEPAATEEPAAADDPAADEAADDGPADDGPTGDCSAAGLDATVQADQADQVSQEASATAAFLLDAAVRCDEQLLFTAAEESDTSFFFGSAAVDEVFALPEDPTADPSAWEALALLLGETTPEAGDGDIWTWPGAAAADADDAAWQELVDSGLYTRSQVDELRTAGEGYLGWRVGIADDGTWLFFTAGD